MIVTETDAGVPAAGVMNGEGPGVVLVNEGQGGLKVPETTIADPMENTDEAEALKMTDQD